VNQLWAIDDVTIVTCFKPKSVPTSITLWQTLNGHHIAIVATKVCVIPIKNSLNNMNFSKG